MQNSFPEPNTLGFSDATDAALDEQLKRGDTSGHSNAHVCPRLGCALSKSVETFLDSILPTDRIKVDMDKSEFLLSFLKNADRLLAECAAEVATVITQFTRVDDVRMRAQSALADLIRQRCFEVPERTLEGLILLLVQRRVDIKALELRALRLRNAASSPGGSSLQMQSSKATAFKMLSQFLQSLDTLPEMVFDYAGGRIFGVGWDVQKHSRFVTMVRLSWADKLATVLQTIGEAGGIARVFAEPVFAEIENLDLESASEIQRNDDSWIRQFAFGLAFALPFLFVSSSGYADSYLTAGALAAAVVSIVFFYRGVSRLVA